MNRQVSPRAGSSIIEFTLMLPWLLFLFAGAFDWGFYNYALISVQNAARVAAQYTSTNTNTATDATTACSYVLSELKGEPNIGTTVTSCSSLPLLVTATSISGPDSAPAAQVRVTYRTAQLVPIPGLLTGQFTFVRNVVMRIRS